MKQDLDHIQIDKLTVQRLNRLTDKLEIDQNKLVDKTLTRKLEELEKEKGLMPDIEKKIQYIDLDPGQEDIEIMQEELRGKIL